MAKVISKVIIPAAGLGTRFLPATKAQPKEMLPVVDKPAIQYVVEEALRCGLQDILIVTGRGKRSLEDHFDRSFELEYYLEGSMKLAELDTVREIADLANIHYVRQGEPKGLGHAISTGRAYVGDDPFAVMLADDIMDEESTLLADMISSFEKHGRSIVALMRVPKSEISHYGCVAAEEVEEGLVRITGLIEKPDVDEAPSDLAVMGRYIFTPAIFEALGSTSPGRSGEIQLTDGISKLLQRQAVYGLIFEDGRYDIGNKLGYLRATVQLALKRKDLGPAFLEALKEILSKQEL